MKKNTTINKDNVKCVQCGKVIEDLDRHEQYCDNCYLRYVKALLWDGRD